MSIDDRLTDPTGLGMRAAGAWKGTHDPEKLKRDIYATRSDRRYPDYIEETQK